ncbi:MAG: bifunctional phosphoribosyl-AMP cyclohydrolase/phosphoribosyl-ATP diphosphatase HisIE, partial [Bacteroidota bacterium]
MPNLLTRDNIQQLDFAKAGGLLPAVVQDDRTGKVLMLGYMNEAAVEKTMEDQRVCFYSRSKERLWTKGESSGHFLNLKSMLFDCDRDCLLVKVEPVGPTCHTGSDTCFDERNQSDHFLQHLERVIQDRRDKPSGKSYTTSLFQKGINKVAQKVGEEAVELVIEA